MGKRTKEEIEADFRRMTERKSPGTHSSNGLPSISPTHPASTLVNRRAQTQASFEYAGFWLRFGAWMVDTTMLTILTLMLFTKTSQLISLGISFLYFSISQSSSWEASYGKKIFGLRVLTSEGNQRGFFRSSVRYLATFISAVLIFGYFLAGFTEKKQALHDFIVDTIVVRDNEANYLKVVLMTIGCWLLICFAVFVKLLFGHH